MCKLSKYWPNDLKGHWNRCCRWVVVGRSKFAKSWRDRDSEKMCEAETLASIRRALALESRVHAPFPQAPSHQTYLLIKANVNDLYCFHSKYCLFFQPRHNLLSRYRGSYSWNDPIAKLSCFSLTVLRVCSWSTLSLRLICIIYVYSPK